jgi:hypothetical protein
VQTPRVRIDWASESRLVGLPCALGTGLPLPTAGQCPMGRYCPDTVYQVIPTKLTGPSMALIPTVRSRVRDHIAWVCLYPLQASARWVATTRVPSRRHCAKQILRSTLECRRWQIGQSLRPALVYLIPYLEPVDSTTRRGPLGPILSLIESNDARTARLRGPKCMVLSKSCDKIEPIPAPGFTTRIARNPARPRMPGRWQKH